MVMNAAVFWHVAPCNANQLLHCSTDFRMKIEVKCWSETFVHIQTARRHGHGVMSQKAFAIVSDSIFNYILYKEWCLLGCYAVWLL
jgi:hypothetical protein